MRKKKEERKCRDEMSEICVRKDGIGVREDQEAFFEAFYKEHFRELKARAYSHTHDWDRAQYVVQDAFYIAVSKADVFMNSPNPLGWMKRTVDYVAKNEVRARKRQLQLFMSMEEVWKEPAVEDPYHKEEFGILDQCETLLSPQDLKLLKRIVLDKVSYLEAADELGITMWACRKRVQRMTKGLREKLERER